MALRLTKLDLYRRIGFLRSALNISSYPVNSLECIRYLERVKVAAVPFENAALRGMTSFGDEHHADVILLNSNRSIDEQNFDCAHEIIHATLHRNEQKQNYTCMDCVSTKQDSYLEWHANEGAAQLLVPYQDFIPRFSECLFTLANKKDFWITGYLADYYCVTERVILNRISNLSYEIDQYRRNVPIENIKILSKQQRKEQSIEVTPYSALCDFPLDWDATIG